jgi:hypothetical protein
MLNASCHCGTVRLEVSHKPRRLTDCNCSICRRYGALWAYYSHKTFRVVAGSDAIEKYIWGDGILEFCHCRICGCVTHHQRSQKRPDGTVGVNVRMMEPEVIAAVRIRRLDGASSWKYLD